MIEYIDGTKELEKPLLPNGFVCTLDQNETKETLPTKSSSSTKWALDKLIFLEDRFSDHKSLQTSVDELLEGAAPSEVAELLNNLIYYINESESLEESLDAQIKALTERRTRFKKESENLRETMKKVFNAFALTKLTCPLGTVSKVTKTASKLVIKDEAELMMNHPELFVKQDPKLDKTALTNRLKDGEAIEGAALEDSVTIAIRK